jgi:hypothetical protein
MRSRRLTLTAACVALAVAASTGATVSARQSNPRYGTWKLKSEAPPPASNLMTYEVYNGTGMKITIDAVGASGNKSQWGYTTMFDGKDQPITGNNSADMGSVKIISDKVNEIVYKKAGRVTQVLTNILSPDNMSIAVVYMRQDADGKTTNVTFATYEKVK